MYFCCFSFATLWEHLLSVHREKGEYQIDYEPAPRITEADKQNDKKYGSIFLWYKSERHCFYPLYFTVKKINSLFLEKVCKRTNNYTCIVFLLFLLWIGIRIKVSLATCYLGESSLFVILSDHFSIWLSFFLISFVYFPFSIIYYHSYYTHAQKR